LIIKRIRENLRLKWIAFSVLLATLPMAIAGFSIIRTYEENLKKSVIEIEKEKAHMVVEKTRGFFEKVTSHLLFLSREESFRKKDYSHIKEHLKTLLRQNDYLVELSLLDEKGMETIKVSKYKGVTPPELRDRSRTEMFRVGSKGRTYYGDFEVTKDVIPTMVIAVPVEGDRDKPNGVLVAQIHLQSVWEAVSEIRIGERGFAYLVDSDGMLISHPNVNRVLMKINMRHLPMVNQVVSGKEGVSEFEHPRGEKFLFVFKPISGLGWGVIVQVPVQEAYKPIKTMTRTALIWIGVSLFVAVFFSLLFTKKLVHPIKQLSEEMTKVSNGNLDVQMKPMTHDEIGLLSDSFNQMVHDLKLSQGALKEAEEKYRKIFENSRDMMYIASLDGKFIDVNQAGVEMFGYASKEEFMQTPLKDTYFYPWERKRFQGEIAREGFVKDFEAKLKRKDGTSIDCLISATVRKDEKDHIIGYEGIIKNISYRKSMEKELIQRTEELQTLYDLSVLINQTLDLDRVLPIALERASSLTRFEMGGIYLWNEEEEIFELKYYRGYPPDFAEEVKVLKEEEEVSGKAIQSGRPMISCIYDYPSPQFIPLLRENGIQSLVGIPLLAKGKAIGAITLLSRSLHHLTEREIHLMESIGNQIGLALENAILFSDVTKTKSEWETTFDAVTDLITIRDKEYRMLRANKAALERFGLKPDELIGNKCYEVLHHQALPCEGCYLSETLETMRPISGERESTSLNGIFQYFTFPAFNEVGEMIAVVDLAREITEEKRLEMEKEVVNNVNKILASHLDVRKVIRAIHSELKRVLDSERMTITLLEGQGMGFRYFASEKEDSVQELIDEEIHPRDGTPFSRALETGQPVVIRDTEETDSWINQRLFQEGIRSSLVFPLEYKGRIMGTVNFGSKNPNHFSEDHVRFLQQLSVGLAISIENSLLLDEIKASEERYRTVVEGAHDGVFVVGEDYRFRYVNERLAEIVGHPRDELIGMDFRKCLDEQSKQLMADRYVLRQRGDEVPSRYEFNILRKDGEIRNAEGSFTIVKDSKGRVNTIGFVKDITERKRMEEQLLQAEKLRALGEMASGVAHDFNNALAAILGNAQILLYTVKEEGSKDALRTIEKVAKDSAQTVRRLQDFTRKSVHKELFKLDVNALIKDAVEITRPKWKDDVQGRGIDIEMVTNFEEIPAVAGSASELREVITNMIFNAIEAMPMGGKIDLRTFWRKEKVYIQISDTGMGMTEEVRKKVFEPFFTTKPFTNTGLGLSMSYGIVKRFGGEIEVESKIGHGTTFTIILPIELEGKEELVAPSLTRGGKKARILVIDDEENVRSVLSRMLSQVSHRVTVAKDGGEGLRLFREREFDMVLTDLGMPGMSGWEVCKAIKRMSSQIPVGMITGWGMELDQTKKEESGVDFVISKPFDFNQILKVVDETMKSSRKRFLS
jgi:PAS domain S-box-containing protein